MPAENNVTIMNTGILSVAFSINVCGGSRERRRRRCRCRLASHRNASHRRVYKHRGLEWLEHTEHRTEHVIARHARNEVDV